MQRFLVSTFVLLTLFLGPLRIFSQNASVADINARIRKEGMDNSQLMKTLHVLTDVYGPRLTGSPNLKAAGEWTMKQMKDWGLDRAEMEPWDFGRPGWVNERASGFVTAPVQDSLVFEVLAWTPGTNGVVTADAFHMTLPPRATQDELTAYFNSVKDKVRGKAVLVNGPAKVAVAFEPPAKRLIDADLKRTFDPVNPEPGPTPTPQPSPRPGQLTNTQLSEQLNKFMVDNGVAVRVSDAGREHGQIRAFSNSTYDLAKSIPTVVMRNEDFGRIARLLADGRQVTLEFDIRNKTFPEGKTAYNTIGEIAGTDKKDEVVMLGGHLDSWHSATGATDNAVGCAIMLEAVRILKALGVKPRRTIRVALWAGEEQGLLGSRAYVKKHFGSAEEPTAEFKNFGGYFNIDSGTGRARGFTVFGPKETAAPLRDIASQFADFGMIGSRVTDSRSIGSSDHSSFNNAGLPGIGVMQDPVEYFSHTWHTNLDTYERIVEDDVKKSAVIVASAVYQLAMRDERLPRFAPSAMPPKP